MTPDQCAWRKSTPVWREWWHRVQTKSLSSHHDRGPKQSPKNLPEERTPSHPSGCTNLLRLTNCLRAKKTPRSSQETRHLQTPAGKNVRC